MPYIICSSNDQKAGAVCWTIMSRRTKYVMCNQSVQNDEGKITMWAAQRIQMIMVNLTHRYHEWTSYIKLATDDNPPKHKQQEPPPPCSELNEVKTKYRPYFHIILEHENIVSSLAWVCNILFIQFLHKLFKLHPTVVTVHDIFVTGYNIVCTKRVLFDSISFKFLYKVWYMKKNLNLYYSRRKQCQ